jgi:hypothetical protein
MKSSKRTLRNIKKPYTIFKKLSTKKLVYGHILVFIAILGIVPPEKVIGIQRIITTFVSLFFTLYWILGNWKKSYIVAISITILLGFVDSRGMLSDYKYIFYKYVKKPSSYYQDKEGNHLWGNNGLSYNTTIERFEEDNESENGPDNESDNESDNKDTDVKKLDDYSKSNTRERDNTNFTDEELEDILQKDKKGVDNEDSLLKKAGGGLGQLHNLIEKAKKDSPYYDDKKSISNYSPAQAQRATYHLVDTVKQLEDTMQQMMPVIKSGQNLMNLQGKIKDIPTSQLLSTLQKS